MDPTQVEQIPDTSVEGRLAALQTLHIELQNQFRQLAQHQAAAAAAQNQIRVTVKPPKPDLFHGHKTGPTVRDWIFQVDQYLQLTAIPAAQQVPFVTTLLRGTAAQWWQDYCALEHEEMAPTIRTWNDFKTTIKRGLTALPHRPYYNFFNPH
jgi:hypothetical protein